MSNASEIVRFALSQVGTCEDPKGTNKTKYGAYIDSVPWYLYKEYNREWIHKVNGEQWCSTFVDYCYVYNYGLEEARKILNRPNYNNYGAVVKYSYNYLKSAGCAWPKEQHSPAPGDIIYFQNSAGLSHVGIVTEVKDGRVYTVEGNSGTNTWYVAKHNYSLTDSYIYGYVAPRYDAKPEPYYVRDGIYTVTCKGPLRLRTGASIKDDILLDLSNGDKVHCLKVVKSGGRTWLRVDGWCCAEENGIKYIE